MNELLKALITAYAASVATKTALPGGLWLGQAPNDVTGTLAYGVVTMLGGNSEWAMGASGTANTEVIDVSVQFGVFSLGTAAQVATGVEALEALYKDNMMSMTGWRMMLAKPSGRGAIERDYDTRGYMAQSEFRFMIGSNA